MLVTTDLLSVYQMLLKNSSSAIHKVYALFYVRNGVLAKHARKWTLQEDQALLYVPDLAGERRERQLFLERQQWFEFYNLAK
jgi:hypothetical protein